MPNPLSDALQPRIPGARSPLRSGADLTAVNADGRTALEVAYLNEQIDVIQALQ